MAHLRRALAGAAKLLVAALVFASVACTRERGGVPTIGAVASETKTSAPSPSTAPVPTPPPPGPLPDYLARLEKDGDLYARVGGTIASAPKADVMVLRSYPRFPNKGPLTPSGERLTILTAKTTYLASEEIRVIHVHEATAPGVELYVMGPKEIFGEYVDGKLASKAALAAPTAYDGAVVQSPGADHNYEVSVHRLAVGTHTLQWKFATLSGPTVLESNVLTIEVR